MTEYVELHCHTCYSMRDGASSPQQLVDQAVRLGYGALAVTDHDGLYGAMEFSKAAERAGIQPITGAEVTLSGGFHLTLLAENRSGYQNLCRLLSAAYCDFGKDTPEVTPESLYQHREGLIVLSGCRHGEINRAILAGDLVQAESVARRYRDWFGRDSFFIELQHQLVQGDRARNAALNAIAQRLGLEAVATNDVHYHVRERHRLHDVMVAIRHRTTLDDSHTLRRPNSEFYLKSPEEMAAVFADQPRALAMTTEIAARCRFVLSRDLGYQFPRYPLPADTTEIEYLAEIRADAFRRKYRVVRVEHRQQAKKRLEEELRLIEKHQLAGFFLTYYNILKMAAQAAAELHGRDPSLPPDIQPIGRGRGSSVASIVCYLIGLSHIDPVESGLFLGRFLNDEMASVPDIDLDFPRDIRAALLERIVTWFGNGRAALVCAFPTYRARNAIRDVGKALGLPMPMVDQLAKLSDRWGNASMTTEMSRLPVFQDVMNAPLWRDLIDLTEQMQGFPRHISQHVGGVILASEPIGSLVPVEPARMAGRFVCQWDKDSVDDARMVKIDFLALGMLSAVDECLDLITERHGKRIELDRLRRDDPAIYDQICAGDTMGVFQIESRAQVQSLPSTQPRTIDDLAVQVAIIRPGPILSGAFHPYMEYRRRRAAGEKVNVKYLHPALEPVLADTLGTIIYQDQVLQIAMKVAGFTAGEADQLRRAMSRKRSEEALEGFWPKFRDGAARDHGMDEATAERIFASMMGFSGYGFPHSHAVAFALLAYESTRLRHYYPAEFYTALFNNQPMGFYAPEVLVGDARRHEIEVLRPDINLSAPGVTVESDFRIRLGLQGVKEVGKKAEEIVAERARGGPFRSVGEFVRRMALRQEAIEQLIAAGAFDDFGLGRRALLWQVGLFLPGKPGQPALPLSVEQDMVDLAPFSRWQQVMREFGSLGLSPNQHPMGVLRTSISEHFMTSRDLPRLRDGSIMEVAGMVVCRQRPSTAKGVVFLVVEDEFGLTNVIISAALYEEQRLMIRSEPFLIVRGQLQRRNDTINLLAQHFAPLPTPGRMTVPSHDFH